MATFCRLTAVILLANSSALFASESSANFPVQSFDQKALTMVDGVRDTLSNQLIFISNYVDNFFADERMEDEGSKSKVVLSYILAHDDFRGSSREFFLKARLHFPQTEERLRLIIDSSDEDETDVTETTAAASATENTLYDLKAALQYIFLSSKLWQVSANSGVRFSVPLDPFVRLRVRRLFFVDKIKLRFVQSVFWFQSEGWGETTAFDIEKSISEELFFRSSSQVTGYADTNVLVFSQSFSLFQDIGKKKLMVYSLGMNADLNLPAITTRYYINARYRHNFYKNWAFYELVPSINFERENEFNASPGILLRMDIVFG